MPDGPRKLRVEFSSPEEFLREYNSNLMNGGLFVSTMDAFDVHEPVSVEPRTLVPRVIREDNRSRPKGVEEQDATDA